MTNPSRKISTAALLNGLVRHAPLALKNFNLYFKNLYRRKVLRTNVVAPYAAILYATHKCNLDCTYCTQKEPDVFSDELNTKDTLRLLRIIRRETDSIVFTGGETHAPRRPGRLADRGAARDWLPFGHAHHQRDAAGPAASRVRRRDRPGDQPGRADDGSVEPAVEARGPAQGARKTLRWRNRVCRIRARSPSAR